MEFVRRPLIQRFLTLGVTLVITGCPSRHPIEPARGVQVSGGGSVFFSTSGEVNAALDRALALASEPDPSKNIVVQFWNSLGRNSKIGFIKTPTNIFPGLIPNADGSAVDLSKNADQFKSPMLQALKKNKITRLSQGDCLNSPTLQHRDASVSAFNVNADICFGVGNLRRVPPSTLLREVLSLVVHEASHLGGADEDEAVTWQQEFTAYFGARFGDLETDTVTDGTLKKIGEARIILSHATDVAYQNSRDQKIFEYIIKFGDTVATLPYFQDPLALELKTNPIHPELIPNYSYAVLALIQKVTIKFQIRRDMLSVQGIKIPLDFMPDDQIVPSLDDLGKSLGQVEENFLAFLGGSPGARSVCVLPDGTPDLNVFPIKPTGPIMPMQLPKKCDPSY